MLYAKCPVYKSSINIGDPPLPLNIALGLVFYEFPKPRSVICLIEIYYFQFYSQLMKQPWPSKQLHVALLAHWFPVEGVSFILKQKEPQDKKLL